MSATTRKIYRLSDNQAKILAAASLDSRQSIASLARLASVKETTARAAISELTRLQIIKPFVLVNIHSLGFLDYCLFISLEPKTKNSREQFLAYLDRTPQAVYVAELGGEYHYTVSFISRNISEVDKFLLDIAKYADGKVIDKAFSLRTDWYLFRNKWLAKTRARVNQLHRGAEVAAYELSDERFLKAVVDSPQLTLAEIGRQLKMPLSTISHQAKQLEKAGVILGYPYLVDVSKLGVQSFRLLIYETQTDSNLRSQLLEFAKDHPAIVHFVHAIGSWDYELNVEVFDGSEVTILIQQLYDRFRSEIRQIKVLAQLKVHKVRAFPR